MSNIVLGQRSFSLEDQLRFAEFSGDYNPIHVDEVAARRTLAGQCIVHGMHGLLWALDSLAAVASSPVSKVFVRFLKPIFLAEEVSCFWDESNSSLSLETEGVVFTTIKIESNGDRIDGACPMPEKLRTIPKNPTLQECAELIDQQLDVSVDVALAEAMFPHICAISGTAVAGDIAALSKLVGMECPGLNSLYVSLQAEVNSNAGTPTYSVEKIDERFKLVGIAVKGRALVGKIDAVYRPTPVVSRHITELERCVAEGEFAGVRAMIIGGSRGLGELVAKLLAVGGGESVISYSVGKAETDRVCEQIRSWGGKCETRRLDVDASTAMLPELTEFNQVYYFASPKIEPSRTPSYDKVKMESYRRIYVSAFAAICKRIIASTKACSIFYPSTVFIDDTPRGFESYVEAKRDGEAVCRSVDRNANIRVVCPRLPRLATDQNQSIVPVKVEDEVDVLLPFLRKMRV